MTEERKDQVATPSVKVDGSLDQTDNFEIISPKDVAVDSTARALAANELAAVDAAAAREFYEDQAARRAGGSGEDAARPVGQPDVEEQRDAVARGVETAEAVVADRIVDNVSAVEVPTQEAPAKPDASDATGVFAPAQTDQVGDVADADATAAGVESDAEARENDRTSGPETAPPDRPDGK